MEIRKYNPNEPLVADGVYSGVPFDMYCRLPRMNSNTLRWALTSAKHLYAAMEGLLGFEDTPDTFIGRAIHCKVLEPERFEEEFPVAGLCCQQLKSGKRKGQRCSLPGVAVERDYSHKCDAWLCGRHATDSNSDEVKGGALSPQQNQRVIGAANAVFKSRWAREYLFESLGTELTVLCTLSGIPCKCRLDFLCDGLIGDVKKVRRGAVLAEKFSYAIDDWGYDVQAAMYVDSLRQFQVGKQFEVSCWKSPDEFAWLLVEDDEPHDVAMYWCDDETLETGRRKYQYCLDILQSSRRSGCWAGTGECDGKPMVGVPWRVKDDWLIPQHRING